jgi:hypothetical protein
MKVEESLKIPSTWVCVGEFCGGEAYQNTHGLRVILMVEKHDDGNWRHLSVSMESNLPSWDDLHEVKRIFFGDDAFVVQIIPPESQYVNYHPYCLHLWQYLDGKRWPIEDR